MGHNAIVIIRPSRSNYVYAGVFLFLAVIILALTQLRGIHSVSDAIIVSLVVGGPALLGISSLLNAAVAKITVDGDTVEVRNRLGLHQRIARAEVGRAVRTSLFAPAQGGISQTDRFLLVGKDGRCLVRLPESDYRTEALERLVDTLGLAWPPSRHGSVRKINREFPGAYPFDYQTVAVAIMIILVVVLAVAALAVHFG